MKKLTFLFLIAGMIILTTSITIIVVDRMKIVSVNKYPLEVLVWDKNRIGINVNPSGLYFGRMSAGNSGERELKIEQVEEDILVTISKRGEIAKWVSFPNRFILRKGEGANVTFSVHVPSDASFGNYTGEAIVILRKI